MWLRTHPLPLISNNTGLTGLTSYCPLLFKGQLRGWRERKGERGREREREGERGREREGERKRETEVIEGIGGYVTHHH